MQWMWHHSCESFLFLVFSRFFPMIRNDGPGGFLVAAVLHCRWSFVWIHSPWSQVVADDRGKKNHRQFARTSTETSQIIYGYRFPAIWPPKLTEIEPIEPPPRPNPTEPSGCPRPTAKDLPITAGWWYTYPSEKWWSSSVGMMKFPTEWKKIVPNHQPNIMWLFLEYAVRCLSHVLDQWKIQSFHLAMCKKYQRVSTKIMYCNAHIPFGNLTVCCGNHGIFSAMVYNF